MIVCYWHQALLATGSSQPTPAGHNLQLMPQERTVAVLLRRIILILETTSSEICQAKKN